MSNFIIKPDGLFPSTYSQMGRGLIPSKDCDNRKIARKFTEKGAIFVNTQPGVKTLSAPYISTFKRFDRPSPLISHECQSCRIISVPSVTDKTVYPCSLGKYSVTGYNTPNNKIGVMGNSMYPRITTSDYQLYQQYRVTDKNNITDIVLPLTMTGYSVRSSTEERMARGVYYEALRSAREVRDTALQSDQADFDAINSAFEASVADAKAILDTALLAAVSVELEDDIYLPLYKKDKKYAEDADKAADWLKIGDPGVKILSRDKNNNLITVQISDEVVKKYLFFPGKGEAKGEAPGYDFANDAKENFKVISFGKNTALGQYSATRGFQLVNSAI